MVSSDAAGNPSGRLVTRVTVLRAQNALGLGPQDMASSNGSVPRLPVIVMRRSGTVQVSVARIGGWPRKLPKRPTTGAL